MGTAEKRETAKVSNLIQGGSGDCEVLVGPEVHAQIASEAKLFSGSATSFGAEPNSHVSLVDAAMPGMLPVINKECIAQAELHRNFRFDQAYDISR